MGIEQESLARLGGVLRVWRETQALPLKRMAVDLDVSVSTLWTWENGKRYPTLENLLKISRYTGIPLCIFLCPGRAFCEESCPTYQATHCTLRGCSLDRVDADPPRF